MSKLICKIWRHRFMPQHEAALLRALSLDDQAQFCDRCGFNTVGKS